MKLSSYVCHVTHSPHKDIKTCTHTHKLTCVQALADMIRVERVMKIIGGAADKIIRFISNQLCHSGKHEERKKKKEKDISVILLFSRFFCHPSKERSKVTISLTQGLILPALAVREIQVHAVAGEEGAGVQWELHAGWVRDGLTQQSCHTGCRR